MSATNNKASSHVTPVSTPPQPSDDTVRRVMERRGAARIGELEKENATLQAQLEEALARPAIFNDQEEQTAVATNVRTDSDYRALEEKYEDLKARHAELEAKLEQHRAYVHKATRKYEAARESAKQWKEYVDKHLSAGTRSRVSDKSPNAASLLVPSAVPREVSDIDITPRPSRGVPTALLGREDQEIDAHEESGDPAERSGASSEQKHPPKLDPQSKQITSSQTTEDDQTHADSPKVKREPSSDEEPRIIREINLKRRRGESPTKTSRPAQRIKQEPESPPRPGSAEQPVEVRSEEYSSPVRNFRSVMRTETSDLDALRGTFRTPRKRRIINETRAISEDRTSVSTHLPRTVTHHSSSLSDSDIPGLPEQPNALEHADGIKTGRQGPTATSHVTPKPRPSARKALHQLSPNVSTVARGNTKPHRHVSNEDAAKVGMLAEDDDETTSQVTPNNDNKPTKTPASARLDAMLENPTPHRQPLFPRQTPDTTKRPQPRKPQTKPSPSSHTKPAQLASTSESTTTAKPNHPHRLEKSPSPIDPNTEPLRLKPLQHLRPQDFRINPTYADSTYAYSDPLNRKTKAALRCLPGCINPSCCGEFLEAARSGILPPSSKTDAQALEAMLGPDFENILASYPQAEHRELLIQARAQEFANEHGRHRKVFERARTPPGFWRTDMPSTQEEAEDRRRADEMERAKVEGMWREAVRGDGKGRWKFRDE